MSFKKNIKYVNINNYNIDIDHNTRLFKCLEDLINDFKILNIEDYIFSGSIALVFYYQKIYRTINDIDICLSEESFQKIKENKIFTKKYSIKNNIYHKIFNVKINIFCLEKYQNFISYDYNVLLLNNKSIKYLKPEIIFTLKSFLQIKNKKHLDDLIFFK